LDVGVAILEPSPMIPLLHDCFDDGFAGSVESFGLTPNISTPSDAPHIHEVSSASYLVPLLGTLHWI
jgi:hypothetical protein